MAPRPLTPPQPSSEMNRIAVAIEMMANAIQQQNMAMARITRQVMHHWEIARSGATAFPCRRPREQMGPTMVIGSHPGGSSGGKAKVQHQQHKPYARPPQR
ncbi:hypothetical protein ACSQ67_024430 [Phaseolus vulgaris]